jgi:hypothetical protein
MRACHARHSIGGERMKGTGMMRDDDPGEREGATVALPGWGAADTIGRATGAMCGP